MNKKIFLVVLLAASSWTSEIRAEDSPVETHRTKSGFLFRHNLTGSMYQVGVQATRFAKEGSPFHWGFEVDYQGQYAGMGANAWIGQVIIGAEKPLNPVLVGGTVGLGVAQLYSVSGASPTNPFIVQPDVYVGGILGSGWRLVASVGYELMAGNPAFSGLTAGIRLDRKSETTIRGVDD